MTLTAPATTREYLLEAAGNLVQDVGWASFSFRDLGDRVGIRPPSIHYHFPTKADLGTALVTWMRERRWEKERLLVEQHPSPRERLIALGDLIAECSCDGNRSCPIYALQAEYSVLPEAMQAALKGWIDDCISGLARWLDDGRASGELRFNGSATLQAMVVWSVLQQGTQLHRTHPDTDYPAIIRQLVDTISP